MKISNVKKLTTDSPVVEITYSFGTDVKKVFVVCGWFSLTGSIKDRVAYEIFSEAIKNKIISSKTKVVEVSSGNMGISVCAIANLLKLNTTIIMPKSMSNERKKLLKLYGAKLILVNNFKEAFDLCKKYEQSGYFCPHQFENNANTLAHYKYTGKKIFKAIKNKHVHTFVAGVGTAGTLMGVGKFLKEQINMQVCAVEPSSAPILSKSSEIKKHSIQGLSDEIVPKIYNADIVDNIIKISDNDAIAMSQKLCKQLSLGVGISGGANFLACVLTNTDAATVFADCNKKYLSTNLTQKVDSELVNKINLLSVKWLK